MTCLLSIASAAAPAQPQVLHIDRGSHHIDLHVALDELDLRLPPGVDAHDATLMESSILEIFSRSPDGAAAQNLASCRIPPAHSLIELSQIADRLVDQNVVLGASAVGYLSPEARADRDPSQRFVLTDHLVVQLDAQDDPQESADAWGAELVRPSPIAGNVYLLSVSDGFAAVALAREILRSGQAVAAQPVLIEPMQLRFSPDDTLYPDQWHLLNTGQNGGLPGEDINAEPAWDLTRGAGVVIGVVDDGLEVAHPDLAANHDATLAYDFNDDDPDPTPSCIQKHGTAVAGVAAALGNNALGVTGVASEATLAGLRLLGGAFTDVKAGAALSHRSDAIHIYSNSWGPIDNGLVLAGPGAATAAALADGVANGRAGKGSIFVWAAGNGGNNGDNANYDGYVNSRYTIGVTATDNSGAHPSYAEPGACILVNAPSSGATPDITTTDLTGSCGSTTGDYRSDFGKTSAATPAASGVVALMLAVNPDLTWRDVQYILVQTAEINDPAHPGWIANAAGRSFNHYYGFGRVQALAAVQAAPTWIGVGPATSAQESLAPSLAVPDNDPLGVESQVNINQDIRVESVEVAVSISTLTRGDLRIELVSPGGSVSVLADVHGDNGNNYNWTFSSVQHWDENSAGTWTLRVIDLQAGDVATLNDWTLRVFGTIQCPPGIIGDYDHNCAVNLLDFATLAICFGHPVAAPPPACSPEDALFSDFSGDGFVNLADFATFTLHFGT